MMSSWCNASIVTNRRSNPLWIPIFLSIYPSIQCMHFDLWTWPVVNKNVCEHKYICYVCLCAHDPTGNGGSSGLTRRSRDIRCFKLQRRRRAERRWTDRSAKMKGCTSQREGHKTKSKQLEGEREREVLMAEKDLAASFRNAAYIH